VGNAPFNPARATASAVFSSSWSLEQLWLFWVAPLVGAGIVGLVFRGFAAGDAPAAVVADSEVLDAAGPDDADASDAEARDLEFSDAEGPVAAPAQSRARRDEAQEFFDGKRG
jgi:aquaporin Z